jgi:RHS repeat-associated protein
VIAVVDGSGNALKKYTWGLDLSGSLHGAGGIGGLLAVEQVTGGAAGDYVYCYDGNGNVGQLINIDDPQDPVVAASYEYDAYGNLVTPDSNDYNANPFRFSTKWRDEPVTGHELYYYGYRYYSPRLGRWLSRDPIGEGGGINLYGFVGNNPIDSYDPLGLEWIVERTGRERARAAGWCGDTIEELAARVRMDPDHFLFWLEAKDGKPLPTSASEGLTEKREFYVPNTVVVGVGEMGFFPRQILGYTPDNAYDILVAKGFHVPFFDYNVVPWSSQDILRYNSFELYGIVGFGHGGYGAGGKFNLPWSRATKGHWNINGSSVDGQIDWLSPFNFRNGQFGLLVLKICFAKQGGWQSDVSPNGVSWLGSGFELSGANWGILNTVRQAR